MRNKNIIVELSLPGWHSYYQPLDYIIILFFYRSSTCSLWGVNYDFPADCLIAVFLKIFQNIPVGLK